ncbi:MAG: hypothetical protein ACP5U1_16750 [Desulfomonilaceae bacterium]
MIHEQRCENCNAGCTGRHSAEQRNEEISGGLFVLLFGALILVTSVMVKWLIF